MTYRGYLKRDSLYSLVHAITIAAFVAFGVGYAAYWLNLESDPYAKWTLHFIVYIAIGVIMHAVRYFYLVHHISRIYAETSELGWTHEAICDLFFRYPGDDLPPIRKWNKKNIHVIKRDVADLPVLSFRRRISSGR